MANLNRRQFISSTALGVGGIYSGAGLFNIGSIAIADTHSNPFARAYKLPELNTGQRNGNQLHFDLDIATGSSNFIGNLSTQTMGINSPYLGTTLRAKRGDNVSFSVKNNLSEPATLHWHGFILPAVADGGPHQVIQPGETWQTNFDISQPASTFWYHSHTHNETGRQVYHGLAGMFIVDDEISSSISLPKEYGVDDIPVIIQDRSFNQDGSFRYLSSMRDQMRGMHGNVIMVNGVVTPTLEAKKNLVRLRLLNGSNARIYNLGFLDKRPFLVIAGDGGFLHSPAEVNQIRLAPGERTEILVDLSNGQDAILGNTAVEQSSQNTGMMGMMDAGSESFNIMKILANKSLNSKFRIPIKLASLPNWNDASPTQLRKLNLEMAMGPRMMMSNLLGGSRFSISGEAMDMNVINFRVKSASFELWEISNDSMMAHPFHIHNTQFLILSRSIGNIAASESGLKDTVIVKPHETVRLLIPFPEFSDPTVPYMYHCHILEHEDGGMMGQFTVEA